MKKFGIFVIGIFVLVIIFMSLDVGLVCANELIIEWNKTYSENSSYDYGYSVDQTSDGGYIIAGYTTYNHSIYLIKTDSDGNKIWDKKFIGSRQGYGEDYGYSVEETNDNGYIVVGTTYSSGNYDIYLIKTDSDGNLVWNKTFGSSSSNNDFGYSVDQTNDLGYIITGYTYTYEYPQVYLVKTDSNGNMIWNKTFGGNKSDIGYSVEQTNDNGYIITGVTDSYGSGKHDVYLIKTDSDGNLVWNKTFGGSREDYGYFVEQTNDNGYIITGYASSFGYGNPDVYLIKTDSDGNLVWSKTFGGIASDEGYSVEETSDGGYIIAGETWSFGAGQSDVYLVKTNSNGNKIWEKTIGDEYGDIGRSIQQTSDGEYIVAGYKYTLDTEFDVILIKLKDLGDIINLSQGWNLISIPLSLQNNSIENVFGNIMDKVIVINGFDNGAKTYDPLLPEFSDLTEIDEKHGYWVKMNQSTTLSVSGSAVSNKTINLATGWNLISHLCDDVKYIPDVFESIMDKVIVINSFESGIGGGARTYDPLLPEFSDLTELKPYHGYWVKMNQSAMLDYDIACQPHLMHKVFVSSFISGISNSQTVPPNFPSFGGQDAADWDCTYAAFNAGLITDWNGLDLIYKAILSTPTSYAKDRIQISGPIYNMNGDLVANNASDLWDGQLNAPISYDEYGSLISGSMYAWTGTNLNGNVLGGYTCNNWNDSTRNSVGEVGNVIRTTASWTIATELFCDQTARLYCMSPAMNQ